MLRGLVAVLFGLTALIWPGLTAEILIKLFGIFIIINGLCAVNTAINNKSKSDGWGVLLIGGIIGIGIGILPFVWPRITEFIILFFIAAWALVTGISELIASFRLRNVIADDWVLTLVGFLSVMLALILLLSPMFGILAAVWVIGAFGVIYGAFMFYLAYRIRYLYRTIEEKIPREKNTV